MPECVDPKSGKCLCLENEAALEAGKKTLSKFAKAGIALSSYVRRSAAEPQGMGEARREDPQGKGIGIRSAKLGPYGAECNLGRMLIVPVNKSAGKSLDDKQAEAVKKQLDRLWMIKEEA